MKIKKIKYRIVVFILRVTLPSVYKQCIKNQNIKYEENIKVTYIDVFLSIVLLPLVGIEYLISNFVIGIIRIYKNIKTKAHK